MAGALRLRPDLEVLESAAPDGSPTLLVHDGVAETFDRVDWPEADLVRLLRGREPLTAEELRGRFSRLSPLRPTLSDVTGYVNQLAARGWLCGAENWAKTFAPRPKPGLAARAARLLFFQIPLFRPDAFLRMTLGAARLFMNSFALAAFLLTGLCGLYLALPRWEEFWAVAAGSATLAGAPGFLAALIAVKVAHELAHAYAATDAGARVKRMGVALFFFMPLPFTDVTDGWRLAWPQRLRVAVAGLAAEMAVGAMALLLWALSPPGEAAAVLARLATAAVASTLVTNLNPGLRFDGYFILVCLTRMENLRARGMGALRALVRRACFGIPPGTAEDFPEGKKIWLCVYAVYAVIYRVLIGAALIALAYWILPKALGLPVAAFEAYVFFLMPALRECGQLWSKRGAMRFTLGTTVFLLLLAGGAVWFFGRWPRRLTFPAVTRAEVEEAVRARRDGIVRSVRAARGDTVAAGQPLAELEAPAGNFVFEEAEWALREAEIGVAQSRVALASRREILEREAELRRREDELSALRGRAELLSVESPVPGTLAAWDESLRPGVAVREGAVLGRVVGGLPRLLSCYPDVETAGRFDTGAEAFFLPDAGGGRLRGKVIDIGRSTVENVGGAEKIPRVKVVVLLDAPEARTGQTGIVRVVSRPESLAARAAAWLRNLAVRESAF